MLRFVFAFDRYGRACQLANLGDKEFVFRTLNQTILREFRNKVLNMILPIN